MNEQHNFISYQLITISVFFFARHEMESTVQTRKK